LALSVLPSDLHIFILGSYHSVDGSAKDLNRLLALEQDLQKEGYDAFLAIHRDSLLGIDLRKMAPRLKTRELVRLADLNLFVFTKTGVRNGLVAELTETQTTQTDLASKHVALIEKGLTPSFILDEAQAGIMSIGPIRQLRFDNDKELFLVAEQVAFNYLDAKRAGASP
jgi:hypothetical protein